MDQGLWWVPLRRTGWMMLACFFPLLFLSMTMAQAPNRASLPVVAAPWQASAPTIDGRVDALWRSMPVHHLGSAMGMPLSGSATSFRVRTDGQWLYFLIEAADPRAAELSRENLGRDRIDWAETLEVMIAPDPDASRYVHFALAPGGSNYDAIETAVATDMDFAWKFAPVITDTGWRAELAIPLVEIGLSEGVRPGDRLAMNVYRQSQHAVNANDRLQAWSPVGRSFHNRQAMGTLLIGSYQDGALRSLTRLRQQWELAGARTLGADQQVALGALADTFKTLERSATQIKDAAQWQQFEDQVAAVDAQLLQILAEDPLLIWQINPWDFPAAAALPAPTQPAMDRLQIESMQGEYASAAFAVANLSSEPIRFRVIPRAMRRVGTPRSVEASQYLKVRQLVEVPIQGGSWVRDALPELQVEDEITLLPQRNAVLWLTLNTHDMDAGAWSSSLLLVPSLAPEERKTLPLEMKILPARVPDHTRILSANWATYERLPSAAHPEASFQDQRDHYTTIHFLPGFATSGMAGVTFDEQLRPQNELDFTELDRWIDRFGETGQFYVINLHYRMLPRAFGGQDHLEDPQAQANFKWWVTQVRQHFEGRGMGVRDFAWYAADEPDLERVGWVQKFGQLMHQADREQQLFVTIYQAQKLEWLEMMAPYVNVWVAKPNISRQQREFIRAQPARFFSYSVLSSTASPYASYRREAMIARDQNSESIGFWSYDDAGMTSEQTTWIPNPNRPRYAVIYEGQQGVVPSVRWEAWRQGIQDYAYLQWLEERATETQQETLRDRARHFLAETPRQIILSSDRTTADRLMGQVRRLILDLLVAEGAVTAEEVAAVDRPRPVCLTGNDTAGLSTNVAFEGRYYYRPEALNEIDTTQRLMDGNIQYPQGWVIWGGAARTCEVVFDLGRAAALSHVELLADVYPFVPQARHFTLSVSDSGDAGTWRTTDAVELMHRPGDSEMTPADGRPLDQYVMTLTLAQAQARYVRIEAQTEGGFRLGEVRIYGWPEP